MTTTATTEDVRSLIASTRQQAGPEMVPTRRDAEAAAKELLERHAGAMTAEQLAELGALLNRGFWGGELRHSRFVPAFSQPLLNRMTDHLDEFNRAVQRLWRGTEEEALEAADALFRGQSALPGAGRSLPSVLLYLRDEQRFLPWLGALDSGLALVTDYELQQADGGSAAYLRFCEAANAFAQEHDLQSQEIDAVLSSAKATLSREAKAARQAAAEPTISVAALDFLAELADNNDKEWFGENRSRYEQDLRDPLAAVFQAVADRYIVGLDPQINVTIKRDEVLARINKWAPDASYYTHLWGAFSRGRKQEDVQLFIEVNPDHFDYGLALLAAPDELKDNLRTALASQPDEALEAFLAGLEAGLVWSSDDGPEIEVLTPAQLRDWAGGARPTVRHYVRRGSLLLGSLDLVDAIGESFTRLHPLALMAWGEKVEIGDESAEGSQPDYRFEDLVRDTHLPVETLREWIDLLSGPKKAALLYGPPGTGKTFTAELVARHLAGTEGERLTVQFHPSFSYEDFMEGLRPTLEDGVLGYEVRPGIFHEFCERVRSKPGRHVFIIDEINRAELGSVLGEVMTLIEYRNRAVPLPYSQRRFSIPGNVVVLATMNTADRSLALVDFALRRRFHAFRMAPDRTILKAWAGPGWELALEMFDLVQKHVDDPDYSPGQTYWMVEDASAQALDRLWRFELRPYLAEFWFESRDRLARLEAEVNTLLGEGV